MTEQLTEPCLAVQERHESRTQTQIDAIKQRWLTRQQASGVIAPPPATTTTAPTSIQTPMAVMTTNSTPKATSEIQTLFEKVQKIPSYIPDDLYHTIQQRGEHIVQNLKTFFGTDYNTPRGVGGTLSLHLDDIIKAIVIR